MLAIAIIDNYVATKPEVEDLEKIEDLKLITITSLFIASKVEDVAPIRLESMASELGLGLFSQRDIR